MGFTRSVGSLTLLVEASSQRQAYNNFRKVRLLFVKIVARTPVLSGELRAAWKVGYGQHPDFSYESISKAGKRKMTAAIPAAKFDLEYDPKRAWSMWVANGVPYALKVENGWSNQAPSGMVRISVMEVFGRGTG